MTYVHGNALSAIVLHQLSRTFNRFGTVVFGALTPCAPTSDIYRGSSRAQFHSDAATSAARRPCDQRHFAFQYLTHHPTLSRSLPLEITTTNYSNMALDDINISKNRPNVKRWLNNKR